MAVLKLTIAALVVAASLIYASGWYTKYTTRVGVIRISGSIDDFRYADQAYAALRDPKIKAVVVVVDSPGGTVSACFETEGALRKLNLVKPVVVTMGQHAASGAYLISTASGYIFARSGTITAGLGVVAVWISHENKLEKEGIKYYRWVAGEMKDIGAEYRSPTPEESAYLRALVENLMRDVISRIETNRPKVRDTIRGLADGTTMYGSRALEHKLVDEIGDCADAVRKAAELAGLREGEYSVIDIG